MPTTPDHRHPPPSVRGILETALYVADLHVSADFYARTLGFARILDSDRLVTLRVGPEQVLLLFRHGESARLRTDTGVEVEHDGRGRLHVAFAVDAADVASWERHLASLGLEVSREERARGVSLFFRDPDDHLIELAPPAIWD